MILIQSSSPVRGAVAARVQHTSKADIRGKIGKTHGEDVIDRVSSTVNGMVCVCV